MAVLIHVDPWPKLGGVKRLKIRFSRDAETNASEFLEYIEEYLVSTVISLWSNNM